MNKNEKLMTFINGFYMLANTMSTVYMNVLLYSFTGSHAFMAIYTLIRIGLFPPFFTIGGKWAQHHRFSTTLTTGLILIMINLVYILIFNQYFTHVPSLIYGAAILLGAGEGFFWLSINSLNQIVSTPKSRANFISSIGLFNSVSSILAPLLAIVIIDNSIDDFNGFIHIFQIVLIIYAFVSMLSTQLNVVSSSQSFSVMDKLHSHQDKQWRYILVSTFLFGIRDSLILTCCGLLVYNLAGNGSLYGRLLAFFAVLQIISFRFIAPQMKRKNRMVFYFISSLFVASSAIFLVVVPSIWGAYLFGILNAIASPIYTNAYQIICMNALQDYVQSENITARIIAKEVYLSFGRALGLLFVVVLYFVYPENYLKYSVILCSLFPAILTLYAAQYHRRKDRLKQQGEG